MNGEELRDALVKEIQSFTDDHPDNRFPFADSPVWKTPLVGFSAGDDPLYAFYKQDIGSFYQTPEEIFASYFPEEKVGGEELTVISWVLPQADYTREEQKKMKDLPAKPWAYSRLYGEEFNKLLCGHVIDYLRDKGCAAVSPFLLNPKAKTLISEKYGFANIWSERHAAFISGLGTFGLTDGLITEAGLAVRVGSAIVRAKLPATKRPYTRYDEYCIHCGACISRCPVGALSEKGHDKMLCRHQTRDICEGESLRRYGYEIHSCGLCQVNVPCEHGIPGRAQS